jgi:hypothetical protein
MFLLVARCAVSGPLDRPSSVRSSSGRSPKIGRRFMSGSHRRYVRGHYLELP